LSQSILSGMSGTGSWTLHRRGSALALSRITPLCFKSSIFKHLQSSLLSFLLIACWLSHFRDLQHLASGDETLPSKNGAQLSNPGKPVHASLPWTEFALASKITAQKTEYNPIFLCSEKGANCLYELWLAGLDALPISQAYVPSVFLYYCLLPTSKTRNNQSGLKSIYLWPIHW
jgi:hypothetical protein